jgi:hypothetical protein
MMVQWPRLQPVQQDGTMMKKKYLLLLAAIVVVAAYMVVAVVVLPTGPGVTKANFDRIKIGMTRAEVMKILGEEPLCNILLPPGRTFPSTQVAPNLLTSNGDVFSDWRCAADGSYPLVVFRDDRAIYSYWADSNETFWDKLRRWVGLK